MVYQYLKNLKGLSAWPSDAARAQDRRSVSLQEPHRGPLLGFIINRPSGQIPRAIQVFVEVVSGRRGSGPASKQHLEIRFGLRETHENPPR